MHKQVFDRNYKLRGGASRVGTCVWEP